MNNIQNAGTNEETNIISVDLVEKHRALFSPIIRYWRKLRNSWKDYEIFFENLHIRLDNVAIEKGPDSYGVLNYMGYDFLKVRGKNVRLDFDSDYLKQALESVDPSELRVVTYRHSGPRIDVYHIYINDILVLEVSGKDLVVEDDFKAFLYHLCQSLITASNTI